MRRSKTSAQGPAERKIATSSFEVEIYTPERLAEFFLNNVMDAEDYLEARAEVESMGIDPDTVDHRQCPA